MFRNICPCFRGEEPLLSSSKSVSYGSLVNSDQEKPVDDHSYRVIKSLGEGFFAKVTHVQHRATGENYALKRAKNPQHNCYIHQEFYILDELRRKGGASHHIIESKFLRKKEGVCFLFLEYIQAKDLFYYISEAGDDGLRLGDIQIIARQALNALSFLARQEMTHGDFKSENILIDVDKKITLIDFAFAFKGRTERISMGTLKFLSPEALVGLPVDSSLDVWSLGVVLIEAYTKLDFFRGETMPKVIALHEQRLHKNYPSTLQNSAYFRRVKKEVVMEEESFLMRETLKKAKLKHETEADVGVFLSFIESLLEFDPEARINAEGAKSDFFINRKSKEDYV